MTNYQSILPSASTDVPNKLDSSHSCDGERVPFVASRAARSSLSPGIDNGSNHHRRRRGLFSVALSMGVLGVVAALVVLHSKGNNSNNNSSGNHEANNDHLSSSLAASAIIPQEENESIPKVEQWDKWKDEFVMLMVASQHDYQQQRNSDKQQQLYENSNADSSNDLQHDADYAGTATMHQWFDQVFSLDQVQAWWQNVQESTSQWLQSFQQDDKDSSNKTSSQDDSWFQSVENATAGWLRTAENVTRDEARKAGQWMDKEAQEAKDWASQESGTAGADLASVENSTADWLRDAENVTGDDARKAGQWMDKEAQEAKDWASHESATVGADLASVENSTADWWRTAENVTGDDARKAGQWMDKEAQEAGEWLSNSENVTQYWVGNQVHRSEDWMGKEASNTRKWFDDTTNVTGHWIRHAGKTSARWFQKEANVTQSWLQTEANVTGHWIQRQSNRTVHWFEADVEAVRIWWSNVTHRDANSAADQSLLYFNSTAAFTLLVDGYGWYDSSRDFFAYQRGLDAQVNQAYCAVATSAALLNSLQGGGLLSSSSSMELPIDPQYKPYPYATQASLFNECTDKHVIVHNDTFDGILKAPGGLSLEQTKSLLECHLSSTTNTDGGSGSEQPTWAVEAHHVDPTVVSLEEVRKELVLALMSPTSRVLVNYHRGTANQSGAGHFSPIGSYSHQRDSFLILDVAKYKYPYVWIPAPMLYRSLMTIDACGTWDYPEAQIKLKTFHPKLSEPTTARALAKSMPKLGCKAAHRGYIVVKQL